MSGLRIVAHLGQDEVTWPNTKPQARHFFQLSVEDAPAEWSHVENDGGAGMPKPFRLFWLPLSKAPLLALAQGVYVSRIVRDR